MHRKISGCLAAVMIIGTFGCLPASGAEIAQTIESVAESQKNAEEQSAVKAGENAKEQSAAETEDGAGAEAYQAQAIEMESLNNARQLGGYVGADGRKVKDNVLIRCGQLSDASEEDTDDDVEQVAVAQHFIRDGIISLTEFYTDECARSDTDGGTESCRKIHEREGNR